MSGGKCWNSLFIPLGEVMVLGGCQCWSQPPGFTDMCHLWWMQLKSIWGILLSGSQADSKTRSWGIQRARSSKRDRAQCWKGRRGQTGTVEEKHHFFFLSFFFFFFFHPSLPLNIVLLLENHQLWQEECRHAAFQQQDRFGLLFCFLTRAGGETMIKSSWFYVKFKYAEKVSRYLFSCSLSQGIAVWLPAAPFSWQAALATSRVNATGKFCWQICFPTAW